MHGSRSAQGMAWFCPMLSRVPEGKLPLQVPHKSSHWDISTERGKCFSVAPVQPPVGQCMGSCYPQGTKDMSLCFLFVLHHQGSRSWLTLGAQSSSLQAGG